MPNNSRSLQWQHFVHHITSPSEGTKHVHLPTGYVCQRQSLQSKTSISCGLHVQQLLVAIYNNVISPCGTWLSAEHSAGDMPHWQIRVPNISLARVVVQNYRPRLPSNMTVLTPKLISHFKAEITVNNALLWLHGELIWGWVSLDCLFFFFFPFLHWFSFVFSSWKFSYEYMWKAKTKQFQGRQKKLGKMFHFLLPLMICQKKEMS